MKHYLLPLLTCLLLQSSLYSSETDLKLPTKNEFVSDEVWEMVKPYLMTEDHPIKQKLDEMFGASRITAGPKALHSAGFVILRKNNKPDKVYVCKHNDFRGYVFKIYCDTQKQPKEAYRWVERCKGALAVKECLQKHRFTKMISVPKKWIYQLPPYPSSQHDSKKKQFILIATDMDIFDLEDTKELWKSEKLTKLMLERIYTVITEVGLSDSVHCSNIPFRKNGKLAFIDTEHNNHWPIPYSKMKVYLNPSMQEFWKDLVKHKGNIPVPVPMLE